MNNIKVSVVIPVYNSEKFLHQCIDSLLKQSLHNIEIICVNDGSDDNSFKILAAYQMQYRNIKVINQPHSGQGIARNTGVSIARGQYIGFVDSDDYVMPAFYEELYKRCVAHDVDCTVCRAMTTDENNADIQKLRTWGTLPANIYTQEHIKQLNWFNSGCSPVLWDKLFKSLIVKKYPSLNLARGQDFIALIDYMKNLKSIEIIDEYLYYYRHHHQSVMSHPESIHTLSIDLQTEAIATQKIISNYKDYPVVDFYIAEIVKSWTIRLANTTVNSEERKILPSILHDNFSDLKKLYKSQFDILYNILRNGKEKVDSMNNEQRIKGIRQVEGKPEKPLRDQE
jgi:glycosyltransferase involved in cell wall biosynthesis